MKKLAYFFTFVLLLAVFVSPFLARAYDTVGVKIIPYNFNQNNLTEIKWKAKIYEYQYNYYKNYIPLRFEYNSVKLKGSEGVAHIGAMIQNLLHKFNDGDCTVGEMPGGLGMYFTTLDRNSVYRNDGKSIPINLVGLKLNVNPDSFPKFRRVFQDIDGLGVVGNNIYSNEAVAIPSENLPVNIEWTVKRGNLVENPSGNLAKDLNCNNENLAPGSYREWNVSVTIEQGAETKSYNVATYYLPNIYAEYLHPNTPLILFEEYFGACGNHLDVNKTKVFYYDIKVRNTTNSSYIGIGDWEINDSYDGQCGDEISSDTRHGRGIVNINGKNYLVSRSGHEEDKDLKRSSYIFSDIFYDTSSSSDVGNVISAATDSKAPICTSSSCSTGVKTVFSKDSGDTAVYYWVNLSNTTLNGAYPLTWKFYKPDGTLYYSYQTIAQSYYHWAWMNLDPYPTSGTWTAKFYINGVLKDSRNFELKEPIGKYVSVSKSGTGSGTIKGIDRTHPLNGGADNVVINCGSICQAYVPYGTYVDFLASPSSGSKFTSWSGDCTIISGDWCYIQNITSDKTVTANFTSTISSSSSSKSSSSSSSSSSAKFQINDKVITTAKVNVRSTPNGTLLGTQATSSYGIISGGPTYSGGYNWYDINYDNYVDGWSAENYLAKTSSSLSVTTGGVEYTSKYDQVNLMGTVNNPNNESYYYYFNYRKETESSDQTKRVASTRLDNNQISGVSASIVNLPPGTKYVYRLYAYSYTTGKTISGELKSFTTLSSSSSISSSSLSSSTDVYRGLKSYVSYGSNDVAEDYHAWEGKLTALFSKEKFPDNEVKEVLGYLDTCFGLYQKFGMIKWPITINQHFGNKGTLAIVEKTCGAGCGAGGKAEIQIDTFNSGRNKMGTIVHPQVWTVGYYEFGRQSGLAFPFFKALHKKPEYLTSAFPEYISTTCRRYLGLSDQYLKEITGSSVLVYKENFDKIVIDFGLDFESFQNLDENDKEYQSKIFTPYKVNPRKLLASLLYYLHKNNGEQYMEKFFKKAKALQDNGELPSNGHETSCQILNIATSIDDSRSNTVYDYLIDEWKFPKDCKDSHVSSSSKSSSSSSSLQQGLVAYYSFDDGTAKDSSGHGNNGTINGGATFARGKIGQALNFDGINDYVSIPDNKLIDISGNITLSAWVKFNTLKDKQKIFYKGHTSFPWENYEMYTKKTSNGIYEIIFQRADNLSKYQSVGYSAGGTGIKTNVWYHITGVKEGSLMKLYIGGVEKSDWMYGDAFNLAFNTDMVLAIGSNSWYGDNFSGVIDEVRIYNRALSASEVASLYNSSSSSSNSSSSNTFTAYNDLSWSIGQPNTNITLYTTGQSGLLKDYSTGNNTSVNLVISGGYVTSGTYLQGSDASSGTDAHKVFNGIVGGGGVTSYSATNLTFSFTGLDPNLSYELVLFGNRNETSYTDRMTTTAISDVISFLNTSTRGSNFSGTSDPTVTITSGYNTANGYVARFTGINPGADGDMLITVSSPTGKFYANALMLKATQKTSYGIETARNKTNWLAKISAILESLGYAIK